MPPQPTEAVIASIDDLLRAADGELVRKSTVLDGLLDLRSAFDGDPDMVAAIDLRLADVPGSSVTPTSWWVEELRDLRSLITERPEVAAPA